MTFRPLFLGAYWWDVGCLNVPGGHVSVIMRRGCYRARVMLATLFGTRARHRGCDNARFSLFSLILANALAACCGPLGCVLCAPDLSGLLAGDTAVSVAVSLDGIAGHGEVEMAAGAGDAYALAVMRIHQGVSDFDQMVDVSDLGLAEADAEHVYDRYRDEYIEDSWAPTYIYWHVGDRLTAFQLSISFENGPRTASIEHGSTVCRAPFHPLASVLALVACSSQGA